MNATISIDVAADDGFLNPTEIEPEELRCEDEDDDGDFDEDDFDDDFDDDFEEEDDFDDDLPEDLDENDLKHI